MRRFIRDDDTRLEDVPERIEKKIREEITSTRYGATMMHMGWKVRGWDDDFFTVLDVVRRVDSGVGSYGVDRYYVLLKGEDVLLEEDEGVLSSSVILDVKFEPVSSVSRIINDIDYPDRDVKAWYKYMFRNEADRAAQSQQRLTSYTDPFVGYLDIDGESYIVRQRSPYKSSFNIDTLKHSRAFSKFTEQVAIETATAHTRGSVAKSPGQFKEVIKGLLGGDQARRRWSDVRYGVVLSFLARPTDTNILFSTYLQLVAQIALSYHDQVVLDFICFNDYVKKTFPSEGRQSPRKHGISRRPNNI